MALTVLTPASDTQLADLDTVKDELGITSNTDDAIIDRLIRKASSVASQWCDRQFVKQTYRETLPGQGGTNLQLSVTPVVSITEIQYSGAVVSASDYSLQEPDEGLVYKSVGWTWTARLHNDLGGWPFPGSEENLYQVDYIAGYDPPSALIPTLPANVERAVEIMVKDWYLNKGRNPTLAKFKVGDTEYEYAIEEIIPPQSVRLLSPFRRLE